MNELRPGAMEYGLEFGVIMFIIGIVLMGGAAIFIILNPELMKLLMVFAFAALVLFLLATGNVVFGIIVGFVAIVLLK